MTPRAPSFRPSFTTGGLGIHDHLREIRRERREEEAGAGRTMRAWALLVPERGEPLDFYNFPFQEELYSDEVAELEEVCFPKAAQVGMSGCLWRWGARRAEQFGERVIYFFPTEVHVTDFGDTRIEPSIHDSPLLLSRMPAESVHHKKLKQIGRGWVALRGTQSNTSVQSVDADALVFDEVDLMDTKNREQAERRLAGARAAGRRPRVRRAGYPSIPGFGIDAAWRRSDKRLWHVTCPACGEEQPLTWGRNVRWRNPGDDDVMRPGDDRYEEQAEVAEVWRCCGSCEASLEHRPGEQGPIHLGRWVPTAPGRSVRGYHVPRLIVPLTDLRELVRNSRRTDETSVESFYNLDLGLPYSSSDASLTDEDIDAAASHGVPQMERYRGRFVRTMGVDVHSERRLAARVTEHHPDGRRRAVWLGTPVDFKEVADLIERFQPEVTVVDSMPERRQARALAATFPGRVVLQSYDYRNDSDPFRYDPKKNLVTVNRTEAIDAMMDSVRRQERCPTNPMPRGYREQMKGIHRRTELDSKGRPIRVYVTVGTEGDDYAHAEVCDLVAAELYRHRVAVRQETRRARGRQIADEQVGFQRTPLTRPGDGYDPGLGEEPR